MGEGHQCETRQLNKLKIPGKHDKRPRKIGDWVYSLESIKDCGEEAMFRAAKVSSTTKALCSAYRIKDKDTFEDLSDELFECIDDTIDRLMALANVIGVEDIGDFPSVHKSKGIK